MLVEREVDCSCRTVAVVTSRGKLFADLMAARYEGAPQGGPLSLRRRQCLQPVTHLSGDRL
jgi:hypothetical protein